MKKYIFLIAVLLFAACGNRGAPSMPAEPEENESPSTYNEVDPQNRQDTVFFGYVLGQPSKTLTNRLIDEGSMDVEHRVTFRISKGGVSQVIYVEGYPFDLYIADKKYIAYLSLFDTNGDKINFRSDEKLMSLQIYIQGTDKTPIIDALKGQYGEPNTPPGDGYESFVPYKDMDAFWNISNKAVYLATLGNFMVLVYEDIIAIREKKNAEIVAVEAEKKYNQEQSKNTKL